MKYDVLSYIESLNIPYKLSGKNVGREWIGLRCPLCGDDPDYHLGVHREYGNFTCWRCSTKGNFIKLITILQNVSHSEAKRIAFEYALEPINDYSSDIKRPIYSIPLPDNTFPFYSLNGDLLGRAALKYLLDRGFFYSDVKHLYYCRDDKKYHHRIIIPVYYRKRIVNFIARSFTNEQPRYLNCPNDIASIPLNELAYSVNIVNDRFLVITEGVFDAIKVGINAVSFFGKKTSLSPRQLDFIQKVNPRKIIVFFDRDSSNDAYRLGEFLALHFPLSGVYSLIPDRKDPADSAREEIWESLKKIVYRK